MAPTIGRLALYNRSYGSILGDWVAPPPQNIQQLHEEMRQAGFFIKTTEESCENFAIIDEEIIWYGNVHLLGKEKIEDSIMRVKEKEIAAELMELTFGQDE